MVRWQRQRGLAHRIVVLILPIRSRRPRDRDAQLLGFLHELLVEQSLGSALLQLQHLVNVVVVIVLRGHGAVGVLHVGQRTFAWDRGHHEAGARSRSGGCNRDVDIRTRVSLSGVHQGASDKNTDTADGDRG